MDDEYIYIYESHMGGYYTSDVELDYNELYCETCGDNDILVYEGTPGNIMEELQEQIDSISPDPDSLDPDYELEEAMIEYSYIADLLGMKNPYKDIVNSMFNDDNDEE